MEKTVIESVSFTYIGDDGQFNRFLKLVIQDHVSDELIPAEPEAKQEK